MKGKLYVSLAKSLMIVHCWRCPAMATQSIAGRESPERALQLAGWRRRKEIWTCPKCSKHVPGSSLQRLSAFGGAGRLLVLWRKHGKWDKKFFSVELGVTTQAIYVLRATLVRHGYVDPNNKRELRPPTKEAASEQGK